MCCVTQSVTQLGLLGDGLFRNKVSNYIHQAVEYSQTPGRLHSHSHRSQDLQGSSIFLELEGQELLLYIQEYVLSSGVYWQVL